MTSPVNAASQFSGATSAASATSTTTGNAASAATPSLGQDAFLKLLMAQLTNQDPLQPTDGTQFVTQLAQFSQVEQAVAQSTTLGNISNQLVGLSNSNASDLVGKSVTVQGSGSLNFDGTLAATTNMSLSGPAAQVTVTIKDSQGNAVRTMKLGGQPAGPLTVTWNGADDSGQTAQAGTYSVGVSATDSTGAAVNVSQSVTGVVTQVSFDKGYPTLTLGSGVVAPVSQLVSVGTAPATP